MQAIIHYSYWHHNTFKFFSVSNLIKIFCYQFCPVQDSSNFIDVVIRYKNIYLFSKVNALEGYFHGVSQSMNQVVLKYESGANEQVGPGEDE